MIIAQISDTHITLEGEDSAQRISDFEAVVVDINTLSPQPDLVVHTGDIVHNGRAEEYEACKTIFDQLNTPVFAIPGNKDNRENFKSVFGKQSYLSKASEFIGYQINDFDLRLLMLDTLSVGSNKGDFCDTRLYELKDWLGKETDKPTAIFMHHPPMHVYVGPEELHFKSETVMQNLQATLIEANNVVGIFTGHVHRETTGFVGNIPTSIMSAVATPVRWGEYADHMKNRPTYQIHHFNEHQGFSSQTRIV